MPELLQTTAPDARTTPPPLRLSDLVRQVLRPSFSASRALQLIHSSPALCPIGRTSDIPYLRAANQPLQVSRLFPLQLHGRSSSAQNPRPPSPAHEHSGSSPCPGTPAHEHHLAMALHAVLAMSAFSSATVSPRLTPKTHHVASSYPPSRPPGCPPPPSPFQPFQPGFIAAPRGRVTLTKGLLTANPRAVAP